MTATANTARMLAKLAAQSTLQSETLDVNNGAQPNLGQPPPRLVRRADIKEKEPVEVVQQQPSERVTRGVVRWFDPQSRRGALRLQGVSGDLPFEPPLLEACGLSRLFKGQEVEARLAGSGEAPRLVDFRLRAAVPAAHINPGVVRARQQKPVMVELKRETSKRAAARDAAEALLPDRRD